MSAEPQDAEEPPETGPLAIGCVVVGLAGGSMAALFAVSQEAGILAMWASGVAGLYWAARRTVSDSSATPPPEGSGPGSGVAAGQGNAGAEGVRAREGLSIIPDPERPGRYKVVHHYTEGQQ